MTHERWYHTIENHDELASYFFDVLETVETPEFVLRGGHGTLKATRNLGKKKWMVVLYRETSKSDGFVITSYFLDRKARGEIVWRPH